MNNHVQFSWSVGVLSSRVALQVGRGAVSRKVSVLFVYPSVMDGPHYLSVLSPNYHICKIEIITPTSYPFGEDPML